MSEGEGPGEGAGEVEGEGRASGHLIVMTHSGRYWLAFPASAAHLRNEYIMVRRPKPAVPRFDGAPYARHSTTEDHARHKSIYFRPWVLDQAHADGDVPYLPDMVGDHGTWRKSWEAWIDGGVLSNRLKEYIQNFHIVYAVRTEDTSVDDDGIKRADARLHLTDEQVASALTTNTRRARGKAGESDGAAAATFELVERLWGAMQSNIDEQSAGARKLQSKVGSTFHMPDDVKKCIKAANASRRKDTAKGVAPAEAAAQLAARRALCDHGSVKMSQRASIKPIVQGWKTEMLKEAKGDGQQQVVKLIADRVWTEATDMDTHRVGRACSEPLRALICGKPGVGKSFITKAAKELFRRMGWLQGQEYQFAAFQAVVADQVGGDTLHHVFHINERRRNTSKGEASGGGGKKHSLCALRWLFIDEVSQIHATLFSDCEEKAREMVQDCEPYVFDGDGQRRPWGGAVGLSESGSK